MLEKINQKGYETISVPCNEVLELIKELKKSTEPISVAEIGIGVGATANEIVKCLDASDDYYMFSFERDVLELYEDIKQKDYCLANIYAMGNTNKTYDSYNWTLAKLFLLKEKQSFLDLTYLDGAHTFFHDGLACCLLKDMTKEGGIIVFDDINWSYAKSPASNPERKPDVLKWYTQEQIEACQIAMVVDIFMKDDRNWQLLEEYSSAHRATYKKIRE